MSADLTVVGVDVGGARKGFHAVALTGQRFIPRAFSDPSKVAAWCLEIGATVVGVDAHVRWSSGKPGILVASPGPAHALFEAPSGSPPGPVI